MVSVYDPSLTREIPTYLPPHGRGRFYSPPNCQPGTTGVSLAANTLFAVPVFVPKAQRYSGLAAFCQSSASAKVYIGIYTDSAGYPGALLYTSGELNAPTAVNFPWMSKANIYLQAGWYWLALTGSTTNNFWTAAAGTFFSMVGFSSATDTTYHGGISVSQAYGALPSTFPASPSFVANCPNMGLLAAPPVPNDWSQNQGQAARPGQRWGGSVQPYLTHLTGNFFQSQLSTAAITTLALTANTLYAVPFCVPSSRSYATINLEVTTLSAAKNVRFGIYNDSNGAPGSLVIDGGAVSVGSTGAKTVTVNQALTPAWYWLAIANEGTPTVRAEANSAGLWWLGSTSGTDTTIYLGWSVAFTYAALPNPFTGGGALLSGSVPRIMLGA